MSDPDEFEKRWKSHIADLGMLKHGVSEERKSEVDDAIHNLEEVVEVRADIKRNKICWNCEAEVGGEIQERCGNCGVPLD